MNAKTGYEVEPVTRQDLDASLEKQSKLFEKNLQLVISPINDKIEAHSAALFGEGGQNGLKGTVRSLSLQMKLVLFLLSALVIAAITLGATLLGAIITNKLPQLFS